MNPNDLGNPMNPMNPVSPLNPISPTYIFKDTGSSAVCIVDGSEQDCNVPLGITIIVMMLILLIAGIIVFKNRK